MRIVTISNDLFKAFSIDKEVVEFEKEGHERPFAMILKLWYKNNKANFAIPFRSNIQSNANSIDTCFPLPRRASTHDYHVHGLHYIKMMPIDFKYCYKYNFPDNPYELALQIFLFKHSNDIVLGAKKYLTKYEDGFRPNFCTDIDALLVVLNRLLK